MESSEEIYAKNQLATQAKKQLTNLLEELNLPTDLKSLGIKTLDKQNLEKICTFICNPNSDIHNLPFTVSKDTLLQAILDTNRSKSPVS